jgi:hypothetical protein
METAPIAALPIIVSTTRRDRFMGVVSQSPESSFF